MPSILGSTGMTQPVVQATTFLPADTTVAKAILGTINGPYRLVEIIVDSDDTAPQVLDIFLRVASTNTLLGSISIPAGTGHNGVSPVFFVDSKLPATLGGIDLPATWTIQGAMEATVTTGKTITVTVLVGQY